MQQLSGVAPGERWLPIPGFEGFYEVSDLGDVRSVTRVVERTNHSAMTIQGRLLVPQFRPDTGYYVVKLSKENRKRNYYIHRLVLMAFVGLPVDGDEACHGNDIRTDNRLVNLRWDSHRENVRDALRRNRLRNHNRDKTHCIRGHAFTEANTVIRPEGRGCRACRRLTERRRYHLARKAG
jgi:hypothetical protein